jgi:excisionase family DNA binding protein
MIKSKNYLTSAEAAKKLGFSPEYIRKLILEGKIKGEKLGRNWIIEIKNLSNIQRQRFRRNQEGI